MIGAGMTALFGVLQALDPVYDAVTQPDGTIVQYPVWPINDDEAKKLGSATAQQLATLPVAKRKSLAKFLNEYAPGIILASAVYEVAGPRLRFSIAVKKAQAQRVRTMAQSAAAAGVGSNGGPGPSYASNGAARATDRTAPGVSAPGGRDDEPRRAYAGANAYGNGAASAFTVDGGLE